MKPIKFKEQNSIFAENQEEYQPLPALKLNDENNTVVSCWKLNIFERVKVMFTGKIWMGLMSFNKPLTPSYLTTNKKELIN